MKFPTVFSKRERFFSKSGERFQPTYKLMVDESGKRELRIVGQVDLYSQIQSYKESTDINVVLKRFANGDQTALSRVQGIYGDFTKMPKTYAELSQRVIDATHLFDSLPLDVRQKFNFSPSEFFAAIGTSKYNEVFAEKNPQPDPVIDEHAAAPVTTGAEPQKGGVVSE